MKTGFRKNVSRKIKKKSFQTLSFAKNILSNRRTLLVITFAVSMPVSVFAIVKLNPTSNLKSSKTLLIHSTEVFRNWIWNYLQILNDLLEKGYDLEISPIISPIIEPITEPITKEEIILLLPGIRIINTFISVLKYLFKYFFSS